MEAAQLLSDGLLTIPVIRCFPGMRGYQTVPNRAVGVSVASSSSANTYGSSTQITAGLPYDAYLVGAMMGSPGVGVGGSGDAYAQLGIDLGPSASVRTIAEIKLLADEFVTNVGQLAQTPVMFPYPIFVPAGMRVAAKTARSVASAISYLVHLIFVPSAEVRPLARVRQGLAGGAFAWPDQEGLAAIRTLGTGRGSVMVPAASLAAGALCSFGASSSYGNYFQVAANLKYDFLITHVLLGLLTIGGQTFVQCGLGIGPSGAEYSISDLILLRENSNSAAGEMTWPPITLPIGLLVPAGSRLSARVANSTSSGNANIDVNGVYVRGLSPEAG